MSALIEGYTPEYISGVMSLRAPQSESLRRLANILAAVPPAKDTDLGAAIAAVRALYPTCTDFERAFMSLTFALATGVGKTRLMGAFIAYLHANFGLCNFFVVAPNSTIYEKLKSDLGEPNNPKYVFKGLNCFAVQRPDIITDDDYKNRTLSLFGGGVNVYVYNIDKFNKENASMKKDNEIFGGSFFAELSRMDDLVLLMDESHHYRAERGMEALNELRPVLGLELTATPLAKVKSKQVPFKNVAYEYPLSQAIADGYTRTPFAVTRVNIENYEFGTEQTDKLMLADGIACHERAKLHLAAWAQNHGLRPVKPFMLVVCASTEHAEWVKNYVCSPAFKDGAYKNKTIVVHSRQKGAESEENTRLLLDVERADNPVEIVIHVNMLKEGWDVNNLYTIVPLRTAASKILREQMVGRGLRLPWGERTGDREADAVMLTAHDKFEEILAEAQKGDSIFKAGNVIVLNNDEPAEQTVATQINLGLEADRELEQAYAETKLPKTPENDALLTAVSNAVQNGLSQTAGQSAEMRKEKAAELAAKELEQDKDLADTYRRNKDILTTWVRKKTQSVYSRFQEKSIVIPRIGITEKGETDCVFMPFELDVSKLNQTPIKNEVLIQNLTDPADRTRIFGDALDFDGYQPEKVLLALLRERPEIDYSKCKSILWALISQACAHFRSRFGENGLYNIVMMNKNAITAEIFRQMMAPDHFVRPLGAFVEAVIGVEAENSPRRYNFSKRSGLYEPYTGNIRSVLFSGSKKSVFDVFAFDSGPELKFAQLMESDADVEKWLRPSPTQFDLKYLDETGTHAYEPDFVAETGSACYLVEIKGEDKLEDKSVLAKKSRGARYCRVASSWAETSGRKPWRYLFIPSQKVTGSATFSHLASQYDETLSS